MLILEIEGTKTSFFVYGFMSDNFNINAFLASAVKIGASDEHIKVGHVPFIRKNGFIKATNYPVLTLEDIDNAVTEIAPPAIKYDILTSKDVDFMYEIEGVSRFRVNYNRQLGLPALVIRNISYGIPSLEALNLSDVLKVIINGQIQNGLVLVTGPTGCGKSTTIASLLNHINNNFSKHIVTIEDPIEYIFQCKKSIVSQRQINVDTASFTDGIKYALRQDPDVIFIGEIRDAQTMENALRAAETGHLVFTTLHTTDAVQTINRIINMFEVSTRDLIRRQLAESLRATVAQKLVYSNSLNKRFPACEVLIVTPTIKDYILKEKTDEIYDLINENNIDGMISMNTSLELLVSQDKISQEEALENSNERNELERIFKGIYQGSRRFYE